MTKNKEIDVLCSDLEDISFASQYTAATFDEDFIVNSMEYRITQFKGSDFNENPLLQDPNYKFWLFRVLVSNQNSSIACGKLKQLASILASIRTIKIADLRHFQITSNLVEYSLVLSNCNYPIIIANHISTNNSPNDEDTTSCLICGSYNDDLSSYTAKLYTMDIHVNKAFSLPYVLGLDAQGYPADPHYFDNVIDVKNQKIDYDKLKKIFKDYLRVRLAQYQGPYDPNNDASRATDAEIVPPIALAFDANQIRHAMVQKIHKNITQAELSKHTELIKYLANFI